VADLPDDQYCTIAGRAEATLRVKGSRFLGIGFPAETQGQFKQVLHERSKRYHDATHHCWAYRLLTDGRVEFASSDAGEPSGTAGRPILSAIEGRVLLNVGLAVTRYFGGTKLGTGGLARAYADCANLVLGNTEIIVRTVTAQLTLHFDYDQLSQVMSAVNQQGAGIVESDYDADIRLTVAVPVSREALFRQVLIDVCKGHVQFSA